MKITILPNVKTRNIIISNEFDDLMDNQIGIQGELSYDDLYGIIKNPLSREIIKNKEDSIYLIPFSHNFNGCSQSYSNSSNALYLELLIIDVDNGIKYDEVKNNLILNNLQFAMYTSFSHTPDHHKFRVLLPMTKKIKFKDFRTELFRETLKRVFPFIDVNTLQYIGYYYPVKTEHYQCYFNDNECCKPFSFENDCVQKLMVEEHEKLNESPISKELKKVNKPIISKFKSPQNKNGHINEYLSKPFLKKSGNGDSNRLLYNSMCLCILKKDDKSLTEIISKAKSEGWNDNEINQKIKSAELFISQKKR